HLGVSHHHCRLLPAVVRVHGPMVTAAQMRATCSTIQGDLVTVGPQATPENASALSDRSALERGRRGEVHLGHAREFCDISALDRANDSGFADSAGTGDNSQPGSAPK